MGTVADRNTLRAGLESFFQVIDDVRESERRGDGADEVYVAGLLSDLFFDMSDERNAQIIGEGILGANKRHMRETGESWI